MPKLKTNKAVKKRFKLTAGGKVLHSHPFKSHMQSTKSSKRKRHLRHRATLHGADEKTIRQMLSN